MTVHVKSFLNILIVDKTKYYPSVFEYSLSKVLPFLYAFRILFSMLRNLLASKTLPYQNNRGKSAIIWASRQERAKVHYHSPGFVLP